MSIETFQASRFADVLDAVNTISARWAPGPSDAEELWFRGDALTYPLLPGLYRPDSIRLGYGEENLQERFKVQGTPYRPDHVQSEWDWYFLSQHHGIPTRLLDWTENLLVAVYFALHDRVKFNDRTEFDQSRDGAPKSPSYGDASAVVWVLDAGSLNCHALGDDSDCVITLGGPLTEGYLPVGLKRSNDQNRFPIAVLPAQSNDRIIAQQGVFTIHGNDRLPLQELAERSGGKIRLAQVVIDDANWPRLWREIERMGISPSSLFPDLDAVAKTVKWNAQYPTA